MPSVPVSKTETRLVPNARRVIAKSFDVGGDITASGRARAHHIVDRILALPEAQVISVLETTLRRFGTRHKDLVAVLEQNFDIAARYMEEPMELSTERRRLIGAYFTQEYSIEGAALSNPSMVEAPSQDGVAEGSLRFVMTLRSIGEGHVSSIQFRHGIVDSSGHVSLEEASPFAATAHRRLPVYDKSIFRGKLFEIQSMNETAAGVLDLLPEHFKLDQLDEAIQRVNQVRGEGQGGTQATRTMHWLALSNYESTFAADSRISERVLFPAGPTESHGMEDARFVRFRYDDGSVTYFAPYTAYDGYQILPQLIETRDFISFRIATLNGSAAKNKGIALFPRKIDGLFVALARLDNENNHLIRSDNVRFWNERESLQAPEQPWELIQIGNSGSPLETEAGWLVLTHGVGPLRQYALGAILLDLDDPSRIIGRLREPLLCPDEDERDGYVPNVVYSCGSMIYEDLLVLPYGFSDVGARIATVCVDDLLTELQRS